MTGWVAVNRIHVKHYLQSAIWPIPLLCLLAAVGVSFTTLAVDQHYQLVPQWIVGTPSATQTVLSTVATAMMTLTTLVLTVTMVAAQLAMGQFSPRIVRSVLQDRSRQFAHGLFIGTFAFSLLAIRGIDDQSGRIPGLTVVVAYVLVFTSILVLVLYVHRASQSLRVGSLIDMVGDQLRKEVDRWYPAEQLETDAREIHADEPGVAMDMDRHRLITLATQADCVLELVPKRGDFVPVGTPLFRVHGDPALLPTAEIPRLVVLDSERTHGDDPTYGFRKLVDIGERSIAVPFTDPTTTVQAIDRLHDCLRKLARVAPPARQPALDRQVALLTALVRSSYDAEEDVRFALTPDQQGVGSGPDVADRNCRATIARPA
ncbi:MAG: DUF2254 domain-containing protein [Pseudonocardiaceae bacterium]